MYIECKRDVLKDIYLKLIYLSTKRNPDMWSHRQVYKYPCAKFQDIATGSWRLPITLTTKHFITFKIALVSFKQ